MKEEIYDRITENILKAINSEDFVFNVPTDLELIEELNRFFKNLFENQEPLDEEFQKILNDHFWKLLA